MEDLESNLHQLLLSYILENHRVDLLNVLSESDCIDHYAVTVNALTLFESNMYLGEMLLSRPLETLKAFDKALCVAERSVLDSISDFDKADLSVKEHIHARVTGLPVCPELTRNTLPKNADMGCFLSVSGTVIRTGSIKLLEYEKEFICNQCKEVFIVQADFEQFFSHCRPSRCPVKDCGNVSNFSALSDKGAVVMRCRNYQEIKIQEQVQRLAVGMIPRSMNVVLLDDIVDCCKPGDDVCISGVVLRRWKPLVTDVRAEIELVILANHVQVTNEQKTNVLLTKELCEEFTSFWEKYQYNPLTGRNHILASFCPQVYGLYVVKLAVALVLVGGVQRVDDSGTKVRGESHLLLVGDPGTGKSQFLKYACKVTPRSVLTTGIGSTSAGLTVTAVKDGGEWQLEAGALVLADCGLCCIDEFNSIREHDRSSIHEAMEQQTISVAKAGLVCKLNTRCTILAATNPKGQYDSSQPLSVNVALASPLLSRFDLVLVLLDSQNKEWDEVVSSFILNGKHPQDVFSESSEKWSIEKIRSYLCHVRSLVPTLSDSASRVLSTYYRAQRVVDDRNAARTTMRLLDSIIRLSQAHAKLMMREHVSVLDAVVAIALMESSMQSSALLGNINALHTSFPVNAEEEYRNQVELILTRLGLSDVLVTEVKRLKEEENLRAILDRPSQAIVNMSPGDVAFSPTTPVPRDNDGVDPTELKRQSQDHNVSALSTDDIFDSCTVNGGGGAVVPSSLGIRSSQNERQSVDQKEKTSKSITARQVSATQPAPNSRHTVEMPNLLTGKLSVSQTLGRNVSRAGDGSAGTGSNVIQKSNLPSFSTSSRDQCTYRSVPDESSSAMAENDGLPDPNAASASCLRKSSAKLRSFTYVSCSPRTTCHSLPADERANCEIIPITDASSRTLRTTSEEECRAFKRQRETGETDASSGTILERCHRGQLSITEVNNPSHSQQAAVTRELHVTADLPATSKNSGVFSFNTAPRHAGVFSIAETELNDDDLELDLT